MSEVIEECFEPDLHFQWAVFETFLPVKMSLSGFVLLYSLFLQFLQEHLGLTICNQSYVQYIRHLMLLGLILAMLL